MENIDKIIIVHGCPPDKNSITPRHERWMNWAAETLSASGFDAVAPDFPNPLTPVYEEWSKVLEAHRITTNSVLIGHSCGAAFLVRWLQDKKIKVRKLILVAPAKLSAIEDGIREKFYQFDLSPKDSKIADEMAIFTSNDFPHHLKSLEMYKAAFPQARIIALKDHGHFLYRQMKTNEFPEVIEEVLANRS